MKTNLAIAKKIALFIFSSGWLFPFHRAIKLQAQGVSSMWELCRTGNAPTQIPYLNFSVIQRLFDISGIWVALVILYWVFTFKNHKNELAA